MRSVELALDVLAEIAVGHPDRPPSLAEIARRFGAPKSTVHAVLVTLMDRGLVAVAEPTPRYRLGAALIGLGDRARSASTLHTVAAPALRRLARRLEAPARVAALEGAAAVTLLCVEAGGESAADLHMGDRELLHCSGVGKALLSTMPRARVRELLETAGMPQRTPRTLVTIEEVEHDLDVIRRRGYAVDDGEDAEGVVCVAASIWDGDGVAVGAVSVTLRAEHGDARRVDAAAQEVQAATEHISALLGRRP